MRSSTRTSSSRACLIDAGKSRVCAMMSLKTPSVRPEFSMPREVRIESMGLLEDLEEPIDQFLATAPDIRSGFSVFEDLASAIR